MTCKAELSGNPAIDFGNPAASRQAEMPAKPPTIRYSRSRRHLRRWSAGGLRRDIHASSTVRAQPQLIRMVVVVGGPA